MHIHIYISTYIYIYTYIYTHVHTHMSHSLLFSIFLFPSRTCTRSWEDGCLVAPSARIFALYAPSGRRRWHWRFSSTTSGSLPLSHLTASSTLFIECSWEYVSSRHFSSGLYTVGIGGRKRHRRASCTLGFEGLSSDHVDLCWWDSPSLEFFWPVLPVVGLVWFISSDTKPTRCLQQCGAVAWPSVHSCARLAAPPAAAEQTPECCQP